MYYIIAVRKCTKQFHYYLPQFSASWENFNTFFFKTLTASAACIQKCIIKKLLIGIVEIQWTKKKTRVICGIFGNSSAKIKKKKHFERTYVRIWVL